MFVCFQHCIYTSFFCDCQVSSHSCIRSLLSMIINFRSRLDFFISSSSSSSSFYILLLWRSIAILIDRWLQINRLLFIHICRYAIIAMSKHQLRDVDSIGINYRLLTGRRNEIKYKKPKIKERKGRNYTKKKKKHSDSDHKW